MAERDFFDASGRRRAAEAIRAVERVTAAEIVIHVRYVAGRYRDADHLWGLAGALGVLCVMLFAPREFRLAAFPFATALGFAAMSALSARLPQLRRLFISRRRMAREMADAARIAFFDLSLNFFLRRIPRTRIRDINVVGLSPSRAAAPSRT